MMTTTTATRPRTIRRGGWLVLGALCALVLWGPALATASAASKPTPVPPTPAPYTGQLILSQQHVAHGTTTLNAAVSQFLDGEWVTFAWTEGTSGGPSTDLGGRAPTNIAGAATTQLHLPADAAPGTYTVTATGTKGSEAQAFVTVDPPNAPSPVPVIQGSPRLIVPPDFTRGISATDANGTDLPLGVSGFPVGVHLTVTARLLSGGAHPAEPLGALGPTDAQGDVAATPLSLPASMKAGVYDIEAVADNPGHTTAGATVTIHDSLAVGTSGFSADFFAGMWNNATQGLMVWWSDFTNKGRDDLLTAVWKAALHPIDPTRGVFADLYKLATPAAHLGFKIIGVLLLFRAIFEISSYFTGGIQLWKALMTLVGIVIVVQVWNHLPLIEPEVYAFSARWTDNLATIGVKSVRTAMASFTTINKSDVASLAGWALGTVASGGYLFVMAYLLAVVVLTKISGLGLIVLTAVLGPLCLPFWVLPQTRGIAQTWAHMALSVASWSPLYAWLFGTLGEIMLAVARSGGVTWKTVLVSVATGAALVGIFNVVPLVSRWFWKHVIGGAAGGAGDGRVALEKIVQDRVPVVGKLGYRKSFDAKLTPAA